MNLTEYGNGELSLIVVNDEGLYNWMIELIDNGHSANFIAETLSEGFNHTDDQFDDLLDTVRSEIEERSE
jgi:hypothetical protein